MKYEDDIRVGETTNGWLNRKYAEEQQAKAQAQAQAEEAAKNQPAPQPESERQTIVQKHLQAALTEMDERAQLTQQQRDYENLDAEISTLSAQIADLSRNYTLNKPQLGPLEKRLNEIIPQHEQLRKELEPPKPTLWHGDRYVGGTGNHS